MINSSQMRYFARQLQRTIPGIESLQLLTVDGMAMHSNTLGQDEDKLSALLALLYSGTDRLADYFKEGSPKGLIMCLGASAYVITKVGDELVLGLQVPVDLGHPLFLQTVCRFISSHEHHLAELH